MNPTICVIIPTYNNHKTVVDVVRRTIPFRYPVIVVNDGSTDDTLSLLDSYVRGLDGKDIVTVVSYTKNQGKGHALRTGFRKAVELGFDYAITLDSDGQHYPEDIPSIVATLEEELKSSVRFFSDLEETKSRDYGKILVVGNRKLQQQNMPGGNTFANYFSNFWFMVQTWQYLPDTQTGYRIYPLHHLYGLNLLTARYEAELELLVLSAWHGVKLVSSPIRVYYPPQGERVSHFRPFWDFFRISVLNTVLCILCLVYGYWSMLSYRYRLRYRHL